MIGSGIVEDRGQVRLRRPGAEVAGSARRPSGIREVPGPTSRALVAVLLLSLAPPGRAGTVSLEALLAEAEANSPTVAAAALEHQAATLRRPQVTSLPDPRLELGGFLSPVETRVGPQRLSVGISQALPMGGKRALRGEVADRRAEAIEQQQELARQALRAAVKKQFYAYWLNRRSREITREMMELLSSGEQVARARYRAGRGGQAPLVKAQVELGMLEDRVRTLAEMEPTFVEDLNALLDRPPGTPLGDPDPGDLAERELTASLPELRAMARELGPELRAAMLTAEQKEVERRLARRARVPDLMVGLRWIATDEARMPGVSGSGDDPLMVTVGIDLPLRRRRRRAEEREKALEEQAWRTRAEDLGNRYEAELQRLHFAHADARRKIALYRDSLIPKGRQSLEATFTAFQAGTATFLDLLDAERVLLDFELASARATAEHLQRIAEIEQRVVREVSRKVAPGGDVEARDPREEPGARTRDGSGARSP